MCWNLRPIVVLFSSISETICEWKIGNFIRFHKRIQTMHGFDICGNDKIFIIDSKWLTNGLRVTSLLGWIAKTRKETREITMTAETEGRKGLSFKFFIS